MHRGVSATVDGLTAPDESIDDDFARVISEMRLVKDDWEVGELQAACDATTLGFEDSVKEWDAVIEHGERWLEGTFFRRARAMGNDIGYDSIVAGGRHATTLHWIENTGRITPGELALLDMGVEGRNLYTADVTRTLPVSGTYTPLQRELYDLVLKAQQAGIDAIRPGVPFLAAHDAAMEVLAHALGDMGLLPVPAEEALDPDSKVYARWTLHGTSHMLGMDVHDCGRAAPESYREGTLAEGMVLTVEPGLYFQEDDLLVPEELRGIGIRIEDDILVTADGSRNLSDGLPRGGGRGRGVDGPADAREVKLDVRTAASSRDRLPRLRVRGRAGQRAGRGPAGDRGRAVRGPAGHPAGGGLALPQRRVHAGHRDPRPRLLGPHRRRRVRCEHPGDRASRGGRVRWRRT